MNLLVKVMINCKTCAALSVPFAAFVATSIVTAYNLQMAKAGVNASFAEVCNVLHDSHL